MNCKKLSLGLVAATILATPAMAQGVKQEPGAPGVHLSELTVPHGRLRCESDAPVLATITETGFTRRHASARLRQRRGMMAPTAPMASLSASGDAL